MHEDHCALRGTPQRYTHGAVSEANVESHPAEARGSTGVHNTATFCPSCFHIIPPPATVAGRDLCPSNGSAAICACTNMKARKTGGKTAAVDMSSQNRKGVSQLRGDAES